MTPTPDEQLQEDIFSLFGHLPQSNQNVIKEFVHARQAEAVREFAKGVLKHYRQPDMFTISAVYETLLKWDLPPILPTELNQEEKV